MALLNNLNTANPIYFCSMNYRLDTKVKPTCLKQTYLANNSHFVITKSK